MQRIMIVSDTHRRITNLAEALYREGNIDKLIHLGDFEGEDEVIRGMATSDETFNAVKELSVAIGKEPVEVAEAPGFVVNRILIPMINEASFILQEGIASVEDIDTSMKYGANHPMGPLELGDFIGLDICLAIMDVLYKETGDSKYRACPLIRKMVRGGNLGAKSGKGFYVYNADRTKTPVDAQ